MCPVTLKPFSPASRRLRLLFYPSSKSRRPTECVSILYPLFTAIPRATSHVTAYSVRAKYSDLPVKMWRRGWDSNPRTVSRRRFSRPLKTLCNQCSIFCTLLMGSLSICIPDNGTVDRSVQLPLLPRGGKTGLDGVRPSDDLPDRGVDVGFFGAQAARFNGCPQRRLTHDASIATGARRPTASGREGERQEMAFRSTASTSTTISGLGGCAGFRVPLRRIRGLAH
jgi:hypothetical protein